MKHKGKLFVFEGGDGTCKTTQTKLLAERLNKEGYSVAEIDFPRYGQVPKGHPASFFERKYLIKKEFGFTRGYGPVIGVNPYFASISYAVDRCDAAFCQENKPNLWDLLNSDFCIVSNRYTPSNIGFQAVKIEDSAERVEFIKWLIDLEYNKLNIPEPDLVIIMDLDSDMAMELKRRQRENQGWPKDAHEEDLTTFEKARNAYLAAAQLFPDTWKVIKAGEKVHPALDILAGLHPQGLVHERIWTEVKRFLN